MPLVARVIHLLCDRVQVHGVADHWDGGARLEGGCQVSTYELHAQDPQRPQRLQYNFQVWGVFTGNVPTLACMHACEMHTMDVVITTQY